MSDIVPGPPSPRDFVSEQHHDSPTSNIAEAEIETETPEVQKRNLQAGESNAAPFDVKALTDRTLHFLATASNETLGACLAGLGAGTYIILGRVGLVLIGVVGGVVLHATWEGHHGDSKEKSAEVRRRELGAEIAHRVLDWRNAATLENAKEEDDSKFNLKLYSGMKLDYSDFKPETAAALTELTDAVIRDYVKYVLGILSSHLSNTMQVVVLARFAHRRTVSQLVPPDPHCLHALRFYPPLTQATRR
jgi:hypothetical protein